VTPAPDSAGNWAIALEYLGGATRTPRGQGYGAGMRQQFGYERYEPAQDWDVRFVQWTDTVPRERLGEAAARALAGAPILQRRAPRLDYFWYRPAIRELPQAQWALEATTTVTLGPGEHTLRTISDDGVRVWVDGALVIDRWNHHESTVDHAALTPGRHEVRVQYFQADGWSELRVYFVRGRERSKGSAGPH
jgi:hypothetical protein